MNSSMHKIKNLILAFLIFILFILSGCGLTVTKVENTTAELRSETGGIISTTSQNDDGNFSTNKSTATTTSAKNSKENTTKISKIISTKSTATTTNKSQEKTTKKEKNNSTQPNVTTTKNNSTKTTFTTKNTGEKITCTIEIDCKTILNNITDLRPEKKAFLPTGGYILRKTTVSVPNGSTVFDVLKLACRQNTCPDKCTYCKKSGIQLEYVYTPGYDSEYVRGIHQLYEKDCGTQSGWMYSVNGVFPNYGCNKYTVKNGDKIKFRYTCDLGEDVGDSFAG